MFHFPVNKKSASLKVKIRNIEKKTMMLQEKFLQEAPSSLTSQVKYLRRPDLSSKIRLKIASIAFLFPVHGTITGLSNRYEVSRTFIYGLRDNLSSQTESLFGTSCPSTAAQADYKKNIEWLLKLRLQGRCSLSSISQMLCDMGHRYSSQGFISQTLDRLGGSVGNLIEWQGSCVYGSDELFYQGHKPVLVTADVVSSAILSITQLDCLTKEAWQSHWQALEDRGIKPLKLITDEGSVMSSARQASFPNLEWQPDSFHAVCLRLSPFRDRLCRQAQKTIDAEYGREKRYYSCKTDNLESKIYDQWLTARQESQQAIKVYDNFMFLYGCMLNQFRLFDSRDAQLRDRLFAQHEVQTAIDLMLNLDITGLKEVLHEILRLLPTLFNFLDTAKKEIQELEKIIDPTAFPFWKRAWQRSKIAHKIKGNYAKKKNVFLKMTQDLDLLQHYYELTHDSFQALANTIFKALDTACAHASATVENINAFIRPFFNLCRDQVSQNTLNLIMFYFNHRSFSRGKRKGLSPFQILSGYKNPKDGIELLLEKFCHS